MAETSVYQIRQRVNIAQTAKGLHQIDCTVEIVDPEDSEHTQEQVAKVALELLKATEKAIKADGRKLVTDTE